MGTNLENSDTSDKVIIITGSNTGIGYEAALELTKRGAHVILACRSKERGEEAVKRIQNESKSEKVYFEQLDLTDLESIRDFSSRFLQKWDRLHVLINNAGLGSDTRKTTKDGFELCIGTNHLGHFLLTNLLLDVLKKSSPSRVINVASTAYMVGNIIWDDINFERTSYNFNAGYGQSKLANILFTVELAKRLEGTNVTTVSLHPGIINSSFFQNLTGFWPSIYKFIARVVSKTSKDGARSLIFCATDPGIPKHSGSFYNELKLERVQDKAKNPNDALRLWELSEKLVGL